MRSFAYGIAILAAVGIMIFLAMSPTETTTDLDAPVAEQSESSVADSVDVQTASLTLNVPEMHCPFVCYPNVKKALEGRDDVASVDLAPQKEEGLIDNPQVIINYKAGFDPDAAIAMLKEAGFDGSSVVGE